MNKRVNKIVIIIMSIITTMGIVLSGFFTVKGYLFAFTPIVLSTFFLVMISILYDVVAHVKIHRAKVIMAILAIIDIVVNYLGISS